MEHQNRVGLIIPSSNTVAEKDLHTALPPWARVQSARMFLADTTVEAEHVMIDEHLPIAIRDVASFLPDVVAFACTSASSLLGVEGEDQLVAQIADRTGADVVSTSHAVASALAGFAGARVAVLTAYTADLNAAIERSLRDRGVDVSYLAGMGITDNFTIGLITPEQILEFAQQHPAIRSADALFISCTNLRAMEAAPLLERTLDLPIVTSNGATADAVLRHLEDRREPSAAVGPRPAGEGRREGTSP